MPNKNAQEKEEFRGFISDLGEGVVLDNTNEVVGTTNLTTSNAFENLDTMGLGNLDYQKHKNKIDKTSPKITEQEEVKSTVKRWDEDLGKQVNVEQIKLRSKVKRDASGHIKYKTDPMGNPVFGKSGKKIPDFETKLDKKHRTITVDELVNANAEKILSPKGRKFVINVEDSDETDDVVNKGFIIDHLNVKPRTLRAPKFIAFRKEDTASDVQDILIEANNSIAKNNQVLDRADVLNIITTPAEEWNRLAIIGEVEKKVFVSTPVEFTVFNDQNGKEYTNQKKRYGLADAVRALQRNKELQRVLKTTKNKEDIEIITNQVDWNTRLLSKLLPSRVFIEHPFEKMACEENQNSTGLCPKAVDVSGIEYDILEDSLNGKDKGKIIIKKASAIIPIGANEIDENTNDLKINTGIANADKIYKTVIITANRDKDGKIIRGQRRKGTDAPIIMGTKTMDLATEIQFKDPTVLDAILTFQPHQTDVRTPNYKKILKGATSTTRIGIETVDKPDAPEQIDEILKEPSTENAKLKAWLNKSDNKKLLLKFQERTRAFEKSFARTPTIRCQTGSVPVIRKWSPDAWGMTPKQKTCGKSLSSVRWEMLARTILDQHKHNVALKDYLKTSKEPALSNEELLALVYKNDGLTKKIFGKTPHELKMEAEEVLNQDAEYKKIVDCNTPEEMDQAETETFKVPLRFPTKNAMGDTMYCKSYKNTKQNVFYALNEEDLKQRLSEKATSKKESKEALAQIMLELTDTKSGKSKHPIRFPLIFYREETTGRKKVIPILKQDANDFPNNRKVKEPYDDEYEE